MKRLGLLLLLCCIIPLTAVCSDDDSGYGSDSSYPYYEPVDDLFSDSSTQSIDAQRTLFPTNAQKILREFDTEEKSLSEFLFNAFSREGLSLEETKHDE